MRLSTMRSGNPALNSKTFKNIKADDGQVMTLEGAINKISISVFILFCTAFYSWTQNNPSFIMIGIIGGLICAVVTIFKKDLSPYTVPAYAALEGLALGAISFYFEQIYPGIAGQAVFLTFGIMTALLFAYKTKIIKITENFKLGVFAATAGIGIVYLINFIMSFWGTGISVMNIQNASIYSIGFSIFVIAIASMNLVLDFDFIEEAAESNVPKYMEWYAAFGLLVTLIWLYLEILRLLAKLNSRRN